MPEPNPLLHDRLSDWGPRYTETPADVTSFPGWVAEPWNTVTAMLFVVIVVYWGWRIRGAVREHPFFAVCLPILLAGGIGGTLFHARRTSPTFFLLDIVPLYGLGLLVSIYLWIRLGPKIRYLLGMIAVLSLMQLLGQWQLPTQWSVNLSYALLSLLVLLPLFLTLVRTQFRDGSWIYASLACFAVAWICRIVDVLQPLPMGTHWLWHCFGAATTWTLGEYVYRLESSRSFPEVK